MSDELDLKQVVNSLVHGTLAETLCRVCLLPLKEDCEKIFTKFCKSDQDYCIADVLGLLCNIQMQEAENYMICNVCFRSANSAYKFYIQSRRSTEILDIVTEEINKNINQLEDQVTDDGTVMILTISEPKCIKNFNLDLSKLSLKHTEINQIKLEPTRNKELIKKVDIKKEISSDDDNEDDDDEIIMVCNEKGEPEFFKNNKVGELMKVSEDKSKKYLTLFNNRPSKNGLDEKNNSKPVRRENSKNELVQKNYNRIADKGVSKNNTVENDRIRKEYPKNTVKNRLRYDFISCPQPQCTVKYRFVSKLREHVKLVHNNDLFFCKRCNITIENKTDYQEHISQHKDFHTCSICGLTCKKYTTLVKHLKQHGRHNMADQDGANICEICGHILNDEEELKEHYESKHSKRYTCYYCGKNYKTEISLDNHVKKHERLMGGQEERDYEMEENSESQGGLSKIKFNCKTCNESFANVESLRDHIKIHDRPKHICDQCSRQFVDARALMWHQRLHSNERPYKCGVCDKSFVSINRRNQHCVCAHSAPTRRCPLCPALFHLTSMVNGHIKRVHLTTNIRHNRRKKLEDIHWHTETVALEDLSVDIQSKVLEMQTADAIMES